MKRLISALFAMILSVTAFLPVCSYSEGDPYPFSDVIRGSWYDESAAYAFTHGYMAGVADGVFSPDGKVTRAMAVTLLCRVSAADASGSACVSGFTDVPAGAWYHDAVEWAYAAGITSGSGGGAFSPSAPVRRQDLAVMLYKLVPPCGRNTPGAEAFVRMSDFPDAGEVACYAVEAVEWAIGHGLLSGDGDGNIDPRGTATRAQAAVILKKYDSAFGHDWGDPETVSARTCTRDGLLRYVCGRCGKELEVRLPAYHLYEISNVPATCVSNGAVVRVCRVCGDTESDPIPATGVHTFSDWKVSNPASASSTGQKTRVCGGCGKTENLTFRWAGYYQLQSRIDLPDGGYDLSSKNIGIKVICVNKKLLGTDSASYTSATEMAVKKFQKSHGLPVTGIVDLATWLKMGYSETDWNTLGVYVTPLKADRGSTREELIEAMISTARKYADAGTVYRIGCSGEPGTYADCSGLIYQCLYSVGISPDTNIVDHALAEYEYTSRLLADDCKLGEWVYDGSEKRGDLLFYAKNGDRKVIHVAISAGNGMIYDAWPKRGVTYRSENIAGYHVVRTIRIFP